MFQRKVVIENQYNLCGRRDSQASQRESGSTGNIRPRSYCTILQSMNHRNTEFYVSLKQAMFRRTLHPQNLVTPQVDSLKAYWCSERMKMFNQPCVVLMNQFWSLNLIK